MPRATLKELLAATLAVAGAMLLLDLTWLGVVARGLYASSLSELQRTEVFLPAAALFYAFYCAAVLRHAVFGSTSARESLFKGAGLGLLAYGTYELTNWAVLRDWPALLVPIDVAWGTALTAVVAWTGKQVQQRVVRGAGR